MNNQSRASLYAHIGERSVVYNPEAPGEFDIVDLSRDMTNSTRIYHTNTDCVREALEAANLVVTDNQALAQAVRLALPRAHVTALPYGYMAPIEPGKRKGKDLCVGVLNHSAEMVMNNSFALKMLHELERPLIVYGERLNGFDVDTLFPDDDFRGFCAACDVLLLPSAPAELNSPTLPLAAMSSGNIAILATRAPGYYGLDAATGVQLLPDDVSFWRDRLEVMEQQPMRLKAMHQRNQAFAHRLNRESFSRLAGLLVEPAGPRPPLSEDCGCPPRAEKGASAKKASASPQKKAEGKKTAPLPTAKATADDPWKSPEGDDTEEPPQGEVPSAPDQGSSETLGNTRRGAPTEPTPIVDQPIIADTEE
jgi:hypothetical protein